VTVPVGRFEAVDVGQPVHAAVEHIRSSEDTFAPSPTYPGHSIDGAGPEGLKRQLIPCCDIKLLKRRPENGGRKGGFAHNDR
jgi:hypothetical protein